MRSSINLLAAAIILLAFAGATTAPPARAAEEAGASTPAKSSPQPAEAPKPQFLRIARAGDKSPLSLETAIVRYAPAERGKPELAVDLVSAVHVAEKGYYEQLNRQFQSYDCVLYELVAPEGTRIPKGGGQGSGNPVSGLQRLMKTMLDLEFQLEQVDYTPKHFVHADMSPEKFAQSMRDRGESFVGLFLKMMGYAMAQQKDGGTSANVDLLLALLDKNRAMALKRLLAEQFEGMGGSLIALEGPKGSTLIAERNKVALEVLRKEIAAGKRKIAIFYGGGHMPDFDRRLRDEFHLAPTETRWLAAWDLTAKGEGGKGKAEGGKGKAEGGKGKAEGGRRKAEK